MADTALTLTVRTRESLLFEGQVRSLTAHNDFGRFDILPGHSNFISLVDGLISFVTDAGLDRNLRVQNALLTASSNKISIFIGFRH